jgi:hypothetical protein
MALVSCKDLKHVYTSSQSIFESTISEKYVFKNDLQFLHLKTLTKKQD